MATELVSGVRMNNYPWIMRCFEKGLSCRRPGLAVEQFMLLTQSAGYPSFRIKFFRSWGQLIRAVTNGSVDATLNWVSEQARLCEEDEPYG